MDVNFPLWWNKKCVGCNHHKWPSNIQTARWSLCFLYFSQTFFSEWKYLFPRMDAFVMLNRSFQKSQNVWFSKIWSKNRKWYAFWIVFYRLEKFKLAWVWITTEQEKNKKQTVYEQINFENIKARTKCFKKEAAQKIMSKKVFLPVEILEEHLNEIM